MRFLSSEKLSAHKYKTPEGYLICTDAILARTGKQTYRKNEVFADSDDDSEIEVDRRPEDVFSDETLASFENKPVTVEHPNRDVNAENHNELSVGFVRDVRRATRDGQDVMIGNLVITDAQTIEEIENGEHCELSCGYDCDIEDEANPVQKNIRGNHVALCERGRAGIARIVDSVKDTDLIEGKTYTSKSGNKLTIRKVNAYYSDYNGEAGVRISYDFETKDGRRGSSECSTRDFFTMMKDSIKDSVYAIKYKRYNVIGINTFEIDAKDVYEALRQFERHVIENAWGTANVNIISVSPNDGDMRLYGQLSKLLKEHANDSTAPADLERIPLEARKEMKEARDKKATLIGIAGQMQDIINRADKIEKDDLRAKAKKILSDLKSQFDIKEADFITVDSMTKDAEYFIPEDGREPRGLRSRSEIKQAANQFGLQLDIDDRQGCFVVGNKQKIIAFLRKYYTDRDVNEEISFISDSIKDDVNADIERVINVAKSRAFELIRQSKNYLAFRYKGNDRNKDVREIAKILPNNMSASWDEDSLEIAIRDVVKDSDYSEARRAVEHWKKENKLAEDIIKLLNQKFSQLSAEDRQNAYEEATGTRFALKYFDSLKKFEIHDGNNITIVRAKDLADAMKKVRK